MVNNYKPLTTFYSDFSIADMFGEDAIKDTNKVAFNEWKSNCKYVTELVMVLNIKCWDWFEKGNSRLSQLYADLYYSTRNMLFDYWEKLDDEELKNKNFKYYFEVTD